MKGVHIGYEGAFVTYTGLLANRTLLGEVTQVYYDPEQRTTRVRVRFFNREPWPFDPMLCQIEAIPR